MPIKKQITFKSINQSTYLIERRRRRRKDSKSKRSKRFEWKTSWFCYQQDLNCAVWNKKLIYLTNWCPPCSEITFLIKCRCIHNFACVHCWTVVLLASSATFWDTNISFGVVCWSEQHPCFFANCFQNRFFSYQHLSSD